MKTKADAKPLSDADFRAWLESLPYDGAATPELEAILDAAEANVAVGDFLTLEEMLVRLEGNDKAPPLS